MTALAGGYRGTVYHLEKPGAAHRTEQTYSVLRGATAKDAASAVALIALLKAEGLSALTSEAGYLRCTIVPPGKLGMTAGDMPPGHPAFEDATTLVWVEVWRAAADR